MKKRMLILVSLAVFLFTPLCWAEVPTQHEPVISTMEEVVVTEGRVKEKKKEITSNVDIIDEEEIKISSSNNLGDLLAEKGIGHIHKYPGASTSIGIRGFRTDTTGVDLAGKVLILLNGRRAGTGNVAKIMTKNIERIEIIRGPASVQYGSAAIGGVVNVITKQGKGKPAVFAEGFLGSYGYKEGSAGFSGKYKAFDFSASFTRDSRNDYDTANGERYYNTGYNYKENSSLNLGYEFLPENRIGLIYTFFDADHLGNPGYLNQNDLDDYSNEGNRSVDFIYNGETSNGLFSWQLRYFDGKDESEYFTPVASNPDFWDDGIPNKVTVDHKGTQAQVSYNQEYLLLTAGFDWINYETTGSKYDPKNTEYDNPAGFLFAKTRLFDQKLIITGGMRYDEYEVDMKSDGSKESNDNISPRIGTAYLLTDWLKLRANYGEAFRMPTAQQLAGDLMMWATHYVGNPDLKPEKSETYEGGLDLSYAYFNAGLTYFHTDFKDKIESYIKSNGDTSYQNLGKAEIDGIEGSFSYDIASLFSWDYQVKPYVSFTYLGKYKDKKTNEDLKYTSDLQVSYGISVSDFEGFSANLNLAYTGKQDITDYEGGSYATITHGSFTVANLTVSKKILDTEKYGSVALKGGIENLFDKDYEYVQGYPMPGRSFFIGMRYDY
ncbi:MAG: TonB-dependent receptor [Deltaproteobacteria bacterium]|nr:TonB-dependent receptor [Deltaproteobacteria bacterium]